VSAPLAERLVLEPAARRPAVCAFIATARRDLWLSVFRGDDEAVLTALGDACRRGVRVRVLLTRRTKGSGRHLVRLRQRLQQMGAEVLFYRDPLVKYHAKYGVVDHRLALVASLNFTSKCFTVTCDGLVITADQTVVGDLARLFDADARGTGLPDRLSARLVVGPEQARDRMRALIGEASRRVVVVDPKLSDPAFLALLAARRAAGVEVVTHTGRKVGDLLAHGKFVLLDGQRATIGSLSLAPMSLDLRRELALTLEGPERVAEIEAFLASGGRARAGEARRGPTGGGGA
jgi:cardiolipin synthase